MPAPPSAPSKPKASEVAADTRRNLIPMVKSTLGHLYKTVSILYPRPLEDLKLRTSPQHSRVPTFYVHAGDPVTMALEWASHTQIAVPFICPANDKRAGGDWETAAAGSEERLCRRSTLSAALAAPAPESRRDTNYPIPVEGIILSEDIVVFRAPHDRYDRLPSEEWGVLPVVSLPPVRLPKLMQMGAKYSFAAERDMVRNKLRAALWVCAHKGYAHIVIAGDFGLGGNARNPPMELAEMWREIFLWDADLRGRFVSVAFVFEDAMLSTTRLILDDLHKKNLSTSSRGGHRASTLSPPPTPASLPLSPSLTLPPPAGAYPTDMGIFHQVFNVSEINRLLTQPDPRYGLGALMTP